MTTPVPRDSAEFSGHDSSAEGAVPAACSQAIGHRPVSPGVDPTLLLYP